MQTVSRPRNPHFDDDRILWNDSYAGLYRPVEYAEQFDGQWRMFLDRAVGFHDHTGVETDDEYIDDRIHELTGVNNYLLRKEHGEAADEVAARLGRDARAARRGVGGRLYLDPLFPVDYWRGKRAIDIGCGAGRWTKTLVSLGASVKSIDVGEAGLESTRRFNPDVEKLDLFDIGPATPHLLNAFDFTLCWGVLQHTHDPRDAFVRTAATVKRGGEMYLMVYQPTYHISPQVVAWRKEYHTVRKTPEEKLAFFREISKGDEANGINYLDMLNTFYNWVIDNQTIRGWCRDFGFAEPVFLNAHEQYPCGHHVLCRRENDTLFNR